MQRQANRPPRHFPGHVGAVLGIAAQVLGRITDRHGFHGGLFNEALVDDLAGESPFRGVGLEGRGRHVGQGDSRLAAARAVKLNNGRGGRRGVIAGLALELAVGLAGVRRRVSSAFPAQAH